MLAIKKSLKLKYIIILSIISIFIKTSSAYSQSSSQCCSSLAPIVEVTMPAVVNISTTQNIESKGPFDDLKSGIPDGDQFEMFREFLEREFGFAEPKSRKATSLGSGFLIDSEGYIVTNNHVISGAEEISVTLSNDPDKTYKAKIIGADQKTDLALLKIEAKELPYLKFGDSDKARVGDQIIAIGNPFGLGGTVTSGIISAKSRLIPGQFDEFIQTDAPMNRGNSGGPLILKDEVIGICSVIISPSGGNVGIGLAIPINSAKPIIKQLKEKGSITRGWLGVKIQPISEEIAKNMGWPDAKGALVAEVVKDSPAYKAGIKVGDVITKFNDTVINQVQKLSRVVGDTEIGKMATIEFYRDGKTLKAETKVEKMLEYQDENAQNNGNRTEEEKLDSSSILGMKLDNINPALRQKFNLEKNKQGVIITKVSRGSIAYVSGIKAGDIIEKFNRINITSTAELTKAFNDAKKSGATSAVLLINRAGSNIFLLVQFE